MPERPYHSASSVALGRRCRRAWAYCYVDGIRDPEVPWSAIVAGAEHTSRQRSMALGKEVHARLESYWERRPVLWTDLPGQIAATGAALLPAPGSVPGEAEGAIGTLPMPTGVGAHAPPTRMLAAGVHWAGYRDLWLRAADAQIVVDYKTTASIARYALTPERLVDDLQACLYVLDVCERTGAAEATARWLYLESKRVRRSRPVEARITRAHALEIIEPAADLARELDQIERSDDAPQSPEACADYGGCPHHVDAGGPCTARRSVGARIQARAQRGVAYMPIDDEARAAFERFRRSAAKAPAEEAPAEEAPAEEAPAEEAPAEEAPAEEAPAEEAPAEEAPVEEAPAPKKRRGRPPKAPAAPPPEIPTARSGEGLAYVIADLARELAEAEGRVAEITARIREAVSP